MNEKVMAKLAKKSTVGAGGGGGGFLRISYSRGIAKTLSQL